MKTLILTIALFCSIPAMAEELLAEAQCTCTENGNIITVTSYVNAKKFCSASSRNVKSSVVVNDGSFGAAFNSLASESQGVLKYTSGSVQGKMELKLKLGEETGTFLRDGTTSTLDCITIEYEMEC